MGAGGSSNINATLWSRGRKEDYACWLWKIQDIEKSFESVEKALDPQHFAPSTGGQGILHALSATVETKV